MSAIAPIRVVRMFKPPRKTAKRFSLSASLLAALCFCASADAASAITAIRFSLDRAIDGAQAPFVLASAKGFFRAENLNVTTDAASGSQDAIRRVASGEADIALADINALIRYRDKDDSAPVKAVFVLYNKAPYAMIARKSRGISTLADIEGKTVGLVDGDLAMRLWPAVAKLNGIAPDKVKIENISAAVREPMLSAGQVDAVSGWSFLSAINLRNRGVPASDLAVLRFADFGSEVYGHALIVNPKFAAENPEAVKAFIRATIAGAKVAIKDPAKAIDDVLTKMDGASRDTELDRLRASIADNILTDDVKKNGLGGVEPKRFETALDQIAADYEFRKRPSLADIFDETFLPLSSAHKIN
jgi:NitT/TauT family transport system substrate-binding protein